jgi:hypothetical protein
MKGLAQLADLIRQRNENEKKITELISRPAAIGHIGEYIASQIFRIRLAESAAHKGNDGQFKEGALKERTVNVKWYALREGVLDISPEALPEFYLVLTGPKLQATASRGKTRPWNIDFVFFFDAKALVETLLQSGVKIGVATSIREALWKKAEVYPTRGNAILEVDDAQQELLALFNSHGNG